VATTDTVVARRFRDMSTRRPSRGTPAQPNPFRRSHGVLADRLQPLERPRPRARRSSRRVTRSFFLRATHGVHRATRAAPRPRERRSGRRRPVQSSPAGGSQRRRATSDSRTGGGHGAGRRGGQRAEQPRHRHHLDPRRQPHPLCGGRRRVRRPRRHRAHHPRRPRRHPPRPHHGVSSRPFVRSQMWVQASPLRRPRIRAPARTCALKDQHAVVGKAAVARCEAG
jgi:hypothetical protein